MADPDEKNRNTAQSRSDPEYVEIGYVRKPVGLEGWCGVTPHGTTLGELKTPLMVFTGSDASLPGERKLLEVRAAPKGYRCLFDGITDRDGAAKLNNQRIYVTKDLLAPPDEMRFYHFELEGMVVVSRDGATTLGRVKAVHNYPTLDALEIESGHTEPVLIPMTNDTILSIDRKTATITLAEKNIDDLFD